MATKKTTKKTTAKSRNTEQKVSAPKKTSRKKQTEEVNFSEVDSSSEPRKSRFLTRKYLYAVAIVLAIIGLLFAASRFWVIAWIDNKPLTKFELYSLLEKRDEGRTTEELIEEKLLLSEGAKQRQSVNDAEVEAEIKKIEEQQGGAEQLDQLLAINRTSRDDFKKLVSLQLLKAKLFGAGINITEDDVNKYIEENKTALPPNILNNPESSEAAQLREGVKEQLKLLRVNENYNNWLNQNLNSSRVMRN